MKEFKYSEIKNKYKNDTIKRIKKLIVMYNDSLEYQKKKPIYFFDQKFLSGCDREYCDGIVYKQFMKQHKCNNCKFYFCEKCSWHKKYCSKRTCSTCNEKFDSAYSDKCIDCDAILCEDCRVYTYHEEEGSEFFNCNECTSQCSICEKMFLTRQPDRGACKTIVDCYSCDAEICAATMSTKELSCGLQIGFNYYCIDCMKKGKHKKDDMYKDKLENDFCDYCCWGKGGLIECNECFRGLCKTCRITFNNTTVCKDCNNK